MFPNKSQKSPIHHFDVIEWIYFNIHSLNYILQVRPNTTESKRINNADRPTINYIFQIRVYYIIVSQVIHLLFHTFWLIVFCHQKYIGLCISQYNLYTFFYIQCHLLFHQVADTDYHKKYL
jgi:hypothetical protein